MAERRDIPSLKALQSFEAAARHRSFAGAASELNVTPSAISHQVRSVEKWLGLPLFVRSSRPIELTPEGVSFAKQLAESFDGIARVGRTLRKKKRLHTTTIATMDSFATAWLIPRLRELPPETPEVHIITDDAFVDFDRQHVDLAVRYGDGSWPDLTVDRLFDDWLVPVCSPKIHVGSLEEIRTKALLHDSGPIGWQDWLIAAGVSLQTDELPGRFFSRSYLAIQAATAGQGIALASLPLVADALINGHLRIPFATTISGPGEYYLVQQPNSAGNAHNRNLVAWLFHQRNACLTALYNSGNWNGNWPGGDIARALFFGSK